MIVALESNDRVQVARYTNAAWSLACGETPDVRWTEWHTSSGAVRLGTTDGVRVERVQPLTRSDAAWARVQPVVERAFETRQHEHRIAASRLARVPVMLDYLYRAPGSEGRVLFFEASKRIPDTAPSAAEPGDEIDPRGVLRVTVAGWLRENGNVLTPVATRSDMLWEQADVDGHVPARPDLTALGVVRVDARDTWIMMRRVGQAARLSLYDVGPSTVRLVLAPRAC